MKRWFKNSWFSCQKYTERMSQESVRKLGLLEWLGYRFHHYWCFTCRRFKAQVEQIESGLVQLGSGAASEESLSEEARKRISDSMKQEQS